MVHFFNEDITFSLPEPDIYTHWINQVVEQHNHSLKEINYIFCSDEYLLQINRDHLDHDYYTDIITFDNSEEDGMIESDIFISIDRVKENAITESVPFQHELNRVMIHGVLHLLGYHDKTSDEKKVMREKEEACISLLESGSST